MGMVNDNKDSFWGPLLLTKYMNYLGKEQADYYNGLPEDVKNSFYGKKMQCCLARIISRTASRRASRSLFSFGMTVSWKASLVLE